MTWCVYSRMTAYQGISLDVTVAEAIFSNDIKSAQGSI